MTPGDHLIATDTLHAHHGVYLGPGRVAQYGSDDDKWRARVEIVSEDVFARGRPVYVLDRPASFAADEIRRRVASRLGEQDYSLFGNNCEHFVNWCRTGRRVSRQVDRVLERTASAGTKIATRLAAKGVSRAAATQGSKIFAKALTRVTSPWLIIADAAQLGTEVAISQRGADPQRAEQSGQAVGLAASIGIGVVAAGPLGAAAGGGLWFIGELVGKCVTSARRWPNA